MVDRKNRSLVAIFNFYFSRASKYYTTKIIAPTILFTYLSFGLFLLDLQMGERLGYGISTVVIIVAQEIVTNEHIPISDETLWINLFIQISTYFTYAALLQSVIVAWIYFKFGSEKPSGTNPQSNSTNAIDGRQNSVVCENSPFQTSSTEQSVFTDNVSLEESTNKDRMGVGRQKNFLKIRSEEEAQNAVRKLDSVCTVAFPLSYTIFLIVMFTVVLNSMSDENFSWLNESVKMSHDQL